MVGHPASDRVLESPFFRPEYTQLIAGVRDDVFVGVAFQNDEPVGSFRFSATRGTMAGLWAGRSPTIKASWHGPACCVEPRELLKACSLRSWTFNHVIASQRQFAPYRLLQDQSPSIDLADGLPEYLKERRKASKNEFFQTERKTRKIQREVGPLRLEFESRDPTLLETLIEWKTPQYRRTKAPNIFEYDWILQVIRRLLDHRDPGFAAYFSPLFVNDELLAINFGLRSGDVYHSWMTTYNHDYCLVRARTHSALGAGEVRSRARHSHPRYGPRPRTVQVQFWQRRHADLGRSRRTPSPHAQVSPGLAARPRMGAGIALSRTPFACRGVGFARCATG